MRVQAAGCGPGRGAPGLSRRARTELARLRSEGVAAPRTGARGPALAAAACLVLAACELEQIAVVETEPVTVAEIYVEIDEGEDVPEVLALLHSTLLPPEDTVDYSATRITVRRADGLAVELNETNAESCGDSVLDGGPAQCFEADPAVTPALRPGDLLEVDVELPDGGRLHGATRVPGGFTLQGVDDACVLPPDTQTEIRWTRSRDAWAYVNETSIHGLPEALAPEGIEVDDDPLYLLGLSISAEDTAIVFPREFGVFNRFELDQDLALRLQIGLPAGPLAEVTITAVDRNYVNWARGGNFNPSGQVRVPSLAGDGTGVFGSSVVRRVVMTVSDAGNDALPPCPFLLDD